MKKRFLLNSLLISVLGLVLLTLFFAAIFYESGVSATEDHLEVYSAVAEGELEDLGISQDSAETISERLGGARVTVTDADGIILADSEGSSLIGQSRADRKEFAAAMESGSASVSRESVTVGTTMFYLCRGITVGGETYYLRVGVTGASVFSYLLDGLPYMVIVLLLDILLCFIFSYVATNSVLRPVEQLAKDVALSGNRQVHSKYKELQPLVKIMNDMTAEINEKIVRMREDRRMETLVLDSMEHGIAIFRTPEDVILINRTASRFLEYDEKGKLDNFDGDEEISAVLRDRQPATVVRTRGGRSYSLRFTFEAGTSVLLITDITEMVAAEKSKNEFIANVTHEMNTPLTSIRGFGELIGSGNMTDEQIRRAAKTIIRQSDRLANLVKSIINFSAIDSDDLPDYEVDFSELLHEAVTSFEPKIQKKKLHCVLNIEDGVKIQSRRERLLEIVNNIVSNAVRYNKEDGFLFVVLTDGENPVFSVRDTGIGIAPEDMNRIFDRFYTVDKSHGGGGGGFGLGLAIVRKLCRRAGWRLSVDSTLGEGTEFRIEFCPKEK